MKAAFRFTSVTAACLVGLAMLATPALAEDIRAIGPFACGNPRFDSCGYGQVRDRDQIVDACDTRADGDGYYVRYRVSSGAEGTVSDGNGAAAGCGIARVGSASIPVVAIQGCTRAVLPLRKNCTGWYYN